MTDDAQNVVFEPRLSADGERTASLPMEFISQYFSQWKHGTTACYDNTKFQIYQGDPEVMLKQMREARALEIASEILGYEIESFDLRNHVIGTEFDTTPKE